MSFKRKTSRPTAAAPTTTLISTGIPSLDDILGGGLPLSCSLVLTAPDLHSQYASSSKSTLSPRPRVPAARLRRRQRRWVGECMWLPPPLVAMQRRDEPGPSADKITIAWRYEQMKPFQTTVASSSTSAGRLAFVSVEDAPTTRVLAELARVLAAHDAQLPCGYAVQDILRFLHGLRALLRRHPHGCASKLGWVSDAAITMDAFTANPALAAAFPGHHGLLRIHTLPAPTALVPASDRFSALRGTGGAGGGGGENNLGFKCTRKRLVFETVHLDVEGGVGERRTSAPLRVCRGASPRRVGAAVEVEVEGVPVEASSRKRVGFQSDRPRCMIFR
ncbi:hypothetical protein B0H13DRAFT_1990616 [Mycena leptocephala]|nr:hypothetical protein B0H13DRAFT_1990616 [Mycena leptocephala]